MHSLGVKGIISTRPQAFAIKVFSDLFRAFTLGVELANPFDHISMPGYWLCSASVPDLPEGRCLAPSSVRWPISFEGGVSSSP